MSKGTHQTQTVPKPQPRKDEEQEELEQNTPSELESLKRELEQTKQDHRRALADYQNLERRMREDQARFAKLASAGLLESMLEPLDHLDLTAQHAQDPATKKALEMSLKQLREAITREGFEILDPKNQPFDAHTMEVAETTQDETLSPDTVTKTVRVGYAITINDKPYVLRPARVVVNQSQKNA